MGRRTGWRFRDKPRLLNPNDPSAYHAEGRLYLAPNARFDFLLGLLEAADIGAKVNDAMRDSKKHNPQLAAHS